MHTCTGVDISRPSDGFSMPDCDCASSRRALPTGSQEQRAWFQMHRNPWSTTAVQETLTALFTQVFDGIHLFFEQACPAKRQPGSKSMVPDAEKSL